MTHPGRDSGDTSRYDEIKRKLKEINESGDAAPAPMPVATELNDTATVDPSRLETKEKKETKAASPPITTPAPWSMKKEKKPKAPKAASPKKEKPAKATAPKKEKEEKPARKSTKKAPPVEATAPAATTAEETPPAPAPAKRSRTKKSGDATASKRRSRDPHTVELQTKIVEMVRASADPVPVSAIIAAFSAVGDVGKTRQIRNAFRGPVADKVIAFTTVSGRKGYLTKV